jgi:hypothetical protein
MNLNGDYEISRLPDLSGNIISSGMEIYEILFWILPISVVLHITEEFLFPGGFMSWWKKYEPAKAKSITSRYLIIINVLLVAISFNPVLSGLTSRGIIWWLSVASILVVNSYFHIKAVILSKRYSPGVITSILIYMPLGIYGYWFFLSTGQISWVTAILCSFAGIAYYLFSSFNHLRRARKL